MLISGGNALPTKAAEVGMQTPTGEITSKYTYLDNIKGNVPMSEMLKISKNVSHETNPELFQYNPDALAWEMDLDKTNLTGEIYHWNMLATFGEFTINFDTFTEILSIKENGTTNIIKTYSESVYIDGVHSSTDHNLIRGLNYEEASQYLRQENFTGTPEIRNPLSVVIVMPPVVTPPVVTPPVLSKKYIATRVQGANRIETAKAVAEKYRNGIVKNVVLATQSSYPDALAGSVLSFKLEAPILLVGKSEAINANTISYIVNNVPRDGSIYILGGVGAISNNIIESLKLKGYTKFIRIGGANRYETAGLIADAQNVTQGTPVVLATGSNFPDALSISSVASSKGYPILLSSHNSIAEETLSKLKSIKPSTVYIVGGIGVLSSNIKKQLVEIAELKGTEIIRLNGNNRYETGLSIAKYFNLDTTNAIVSTGSNFPDALAGSVLAASLNAPIILADTNSYVKQKAYLDSTSIKNLYILGGEGAVSSSIVSKLTE
jgi:putative cell wall-binding protein